MKVSGTLSKKHVHAIGQMVVNMTRLESLILDLLSIFMKTGTLETVVAFAPQQFSSKIDTLKAIYSLGMTEKEAKSDLVMKVFSEAKDLADFRNTVVHAYWTEDKKGKRKPIAVRFSSRGYFVRQRKPISAEEILAHADVAKKLEIWFRGFRDHLRNPPAEPGKPAKARLPAKGYVSPLDV